MTDLSDFITAVRAHVTASSSKQQHMIQPVQLALNQGVAPNVEAAYRSLDAWLELLGRYEATTQRSYMIGMRDALRVPAIASLLTLEPVEREAAAERLDGLIKQATRKVYSATKAAKPEMNDVATGPRTQEELQLRVQLLEAAMDMIADIISTSRGSA